MESQEASRTVITYSGDTRWSYLWVFSLLPVMGVSVWIADVTEHASSTIIQLIPLIRVHFWGRSLGCSGGDPAGKVAAVSQGCVHNSLD